MDMESNELVVMNLLIQEPMRSLTDVMVGVVGLLCWYRLSGQNPKKNVVSVYSLYFLFMGLATLAAGTIGHAFQYAFSYDWKTLGWSFGAISIFMIQNASYQNVKGLIGSKLYCFLVAATIFQLAVFFGLIINPSTRVFEVLQIHTGFGLIGTVLPVHLYIGFRKKNRSSQLISYGLLWALIPALVFNFEIGFHQWFDHSALAHILMIIYLLIMYRGMKELGLEESINTIKIQSKQISV